MDLETGLKAADIHDIQSDIMRSIKLDQLKKMRMSDFTRRARKILRQKKLNLRDKQWTEADRSREVRKYKDQFVKYVQNLCKLTNKQIWTISELFYTRRYPKR